ncbi:NACHT domain-containing protein [Tunturiibacter empetritectus]|uniref:NACHT domain-containing protein n=1 Tax=Tunturiibacter lichenicola TaxID=2051959 RepID=A0A852VRD5_9BACT|nr:NACHT domain-containing protein [Edaphobacter lichenicola]NYF92106.1 hypothetical protein [Edaphobacter lichenicola]
MSSMTGPQFEDEVRRIARARWSSAAFDGAAIVDGRERDGIFVTDEMVHAIECTVLRTKAKAEEDCKKLAKLVKSLRSQYATRGVKGWFVTADEPTADQREAARPFNPDVQACSFQQFCAPLVDYREYFSLRSKYRFGSASDPQTGSIDLSHEPYVAVDLFDINNSQRNSFFDLAQSMRNSATRTLLLGDFGAGKSMTLREIFTSASKGYEKREFARFPIHLNLREHQGQTSVQESLERHARSIGFPNPSQLVRAWRGGFADILLDGFDEIASSGWAGFNKKLKDIRYSNVALIRNFVRETPFNSSILIAGRRHYFDSMSELRASLGTGLQFKETAIAEFTAEQAAEFLSRRRLSGKIPDWLPSRPLLLSYLMSWNVLQDDLVQLAEAPGWDYLLHRICEREAQLDIGLDGSTIRELIERLATIARTTGDGLGPFTRDDLAQAFTQVCEYAPQLGSDIALLRLPGIGNPSADDGTRSFIDQDLADTARAGDVARFIIDPFDGSNSQVLTVQGGLGDIGAAVAALVLKDMDIRSGSLRTALEKVRTSALAENGCLGPDIFKVAQLMGTALDGQPVHISSAYCDEIQLSNDDPDMSSVLFRDCVIQSLTIESETSDKNIPTFKNCLIGFLQGRASAKDLPSDRFDGCAIEEYSAWASTTSGFMHLDVPPGLRVLLSILKKLFLQAGSGRQSSSLFRGIDQRARHYVPQVLQLLAFEGLANELNIAGKSIWVPIRKESSRARSILASPNTSTDVLVIKCKVLV